MQGTTAAPGPLVVSTANPRYFTVAFDARKAVYLCGADVDAFAVPAEQAEDLDWLLTCGAEPVRKPGVELSHFARSAWVASRLRALLVETPRPACTNRPIRFLRDRCQYFR